MIIFLMIFFGLLRMKKEADKEIEEEKKGKEDK